MSRAATGDVRARLQPGGGGASPGLPRGRTSGTLAGRRTARRPTSAGADTRRREPLPAAGQSDCARASARGGELDSREFRLTGLRWPYRKIENRRLAVRSRGTVSTQVVVGMELRDAFLASGAQVNRVHRLQLPAANE
jgi:hypothetical protein